MNAIFYFLIGYDNNWNDGRYIVNHIIIEYRNLFINPLKTWPNTWAIVNASTDMETNEDENEKKRKCN